MRLNRAYAQSGMSCTRAVEPAGDAARKDKLASLSGRAMVRRRFK